MKARILVVEDERTALQALGMLLEDEGYAVLRAESAREGVAMALRELPDLVLLDIRLPDMSGLEALEHLRREGCDAAVIVMTADTASSNPICATKLGAFDFIPKPIDDESLLVMVDRALEYRRLEAVTGPAEEPEPAAIAAPGMVGQSPAMQEVYKRIGRVAASDATVLIVGESGTGKELVANAIHEFSARARGPLVKLNCAAIPENLLEAELFGHEKGAFTHAVARRVGRFERAHGGSLFLDEIAELPRNLQAKLLRAIQERVIERLGSNESVPVDFRLITATAQDLGAAVAEGRFREDLFYRLNVVSIRIPPLRERMEDVPALVRRVLARSPTPMRIREDALAMLMSHHWPGNVRELENTVHGAMVLSPGGVITPETIQIATPSLRAHRDWVDDLPYREGYRDVIRRAEVGMIRAALREAKGNKTEAARILRIQRSVLYEKLKELAID